MTEDGPTRAGSLADWLRDRDDHDLATLLRRRPDLAIPLPPDVPTLAGRLGVRTSVQRAVDALHAFTLRVLEALVLASDSDGDVDSSAAVCVPGGGRPTAGAGGGGWGFVRGCAGGGRA